MSDYSFLLVLILLLSILILFTHRKNKAEFFIILTSVLGGAFVFLFSLLFAGKHGDGYCYIIHFDIILQMQILFIFVILIAVSFLSENKKVFYSVFCIISIVYLLYMLLFFVQNNKDANQYLMIDDYKNRWLEERIFLYYLYTDKKVILSKGMGDTVARYGLNYFLKIYGVSIWKKTIQYTDNPSEVEDIYLKNGGPVISEEEKEKCDFNLLRNKNYILTGKIN